MKRVPIRIDPVVLDLHGAVRQLGECAALNPRLRSRFERRLLDVQHPDTHGGLVRLGKDNRRHDSKAQGHDRGVREW